MSRKPIFKKGCGRRIEAEILPGVVTFQFYMP
jgi:hypothetical protein